MATNNPIFTAKYTVSLHHSQVELISSLLSSRTLRGFPAELVPRQAVSAQPALVQGVSLSQVHNFAFIQVQYCEAPVGTGALQVHLDSISDLTSSHDVPRSCHMQT